MSKTIKNFEKYLSKNPLLNGEEFLKHIIMDSDCLLEDINNQAVSSDCFDIILVGKIAKAGTSYLGKYKSQLKKVFPLWFIDEAKVLYDEDNTCTPYNILTILKENKFKYVYINSVLEGGLYKSLYEIWKKLQCGFEIEYSKVPVSQITIELCEYYDLDPWGMLSGQCCIIVAENGYKIAKALKNYNYEATVIGLVLSTKDKLIIHKENISRVNRPPADSLLQLLQRDI